MKTLLGGSPTRFDVTSFSAELLKDLSPLLPPEEIDPRKDLSRYRRDPVGYVTEFLGIALTDADARPKDGCFFLPGAFSTRKPNPFLNEKEERDEYVTNLPYVIPLYETGREHGRSPGADGGSGVRGAAAGVCADLERGVQRRPQLRAEPG